MSRLKGSKLSPEHKVKISLALNGNKNMLGRLKNGYKWSGKASDLLEVLKTQVGEQVVRLKTWPKQPNFLSNKLRRCATFLREKGILIEWTKSGDRIITITKTVQTAQTVHYEPENKIRPDTNIASSQSVINDQANDYDELQDEVI